MPDYDPTALVAVCNSIVEDGELTKKELLNLGQWLNEHHESHRHWPADQLFQLMREAFSDRRITATEMRAIGKLLVRIRHEWAKRQRESVSDAFEKLDHPQIPTIDLSQALLPSIAFEARVNSHSDSANIYNVDLRGPTCTCPDWTGMRRKLSVGDLSRCCKHAFDAFSQVKPVSGWPGWLGAFLELAWAPDPRQKWVVLNLDESLVLASSAPRGWADVFAESENTYDRFGYNVDEDRWAYGIEPANCSQIAKAVRAMTR